MKTLLQYATRGGAWCLTMIGLGKFNSYQKLLWPCHYFLSRRVIDHIVHSPRTSKQVQGHGKELQGARAIKPR